MKHTAETKQKMSVSRHATWKKKTYRDKQKDNPWRKFVIIPRKKTYGG